LTTRALEPREAATPPFRLTALAHGGGCGCKLAPSVLQELLGKANIATPFERLLVGTETGDDAAVWRLDDDNCVIATTDFFTPIVDDPRDFGRIAAVNAMSDVYAMGGTPLMALAILGMPIDKMPLAIVRDILAGGAEACAAAGIPVAGGHSIDSPEPIYGLAVIGHCRREHLRRNSTAQAGDALILTKPLGVGVYSAAFKKSALPEEAYAEMIEVTTRLNKIGATLGRDPDVHAITDVTGFGLLGHALEIARGAALRVRLDLAAIPFLSQAERLAQEGFITGASNRNWASYGDKVHAADDLPLWRRQLLTDPQTSGGLLVACVARSASRLLDQILAAGYAGAAIVGAAEAGAPQATVVS
jgi:selenide,water dikinase